VGYGGLLLIGNIARLRDDAERSFAVPSAGGLAIHRSWHRSIVLSVVGLSHGGFFLPVSIMSRVNNAVLELDSAKRGQRSEVDLDPPPYVQPSCYSYVR
jgi:hypothetical protein